MDFETYQDIDKSYQSNIRLEHETHHLLVQTEEWPYKHAEQVQIDSFAHWVSQGWDIPFAIKHASLHSV